MSAIQQVLLAGGGPSFNPTSIFGGSDKGGFYDFTDSATLWSNSARSTPASIGGQIQGVTDLSGKGNHLATSSSTILMQSGYADFPGGVSGLGAAVASPGSSAGHTCIVAFRPGSVTGNQSLFDCDYANLTADRVSQTLLIATTSLYSLAFTGTAGANTVSTAASGIASGTDYYATMWRSTSEHVTRLNGALIQNTTASTANPAVGTAQSKWVIGSAYAGTTNPTQRYYTGRIYAALFINRQLTSGELSDLENYFRIKAGL